MFHRAGCSGVASFEDVDSPRSVGGPSPYGILSGVAIEEEGIEDRIDKAVGLWMDVRPASVTVPNLLVLGSQSHAELWHAVAKNACLHGQHDYLDYSGMMVVEGKNVEPDAVIVAQR